MPPIKRIIAWLLMISGGIVIINSLFIFSTYGFFAPNTIADSARLSCEHLPCSLEDLKIKDLYTNTSGYLTLGLISFFSGLHLFKRKKWTWIILVIVLSLILLYSTNYVYYFINLPGAISAIILCFLILGRLKKMVIPPNTGSNIVP